MLPSETIKLLNAQVMDEFFSANLYMSMSSWCYTHSFDGAGLFLFEHASDEYAHATKIITYLNENEVGVHLKEIKAPEHEFKNLVEVFEKAYKHEQHITHSINTLVDKMLSTKDYATFNFLQWYVAEQHEEEVLFKNILDKIKLMGESGHGLYLADQYIRSIAKDQK
ncbi:ferritin [Helicobacter felis]|uniref:Ferritin n=1 Tax=Helicobacter felis (strain ATCC 49179 / CCUG 28539 / NCTC 12436 / CS1) TaxID=936155 RepID=E7ABY7_HELFC|nr:ferritin [Helicobacter felis]CBY82956.1 ferritin [Helicobacter felis ATCC 49179]